MNPPQPTTNRSTTNPRRRALTIATITILALANVGIIILLLFAAGAADGGKILEAIWYYLLGSLMLGTVLSFFKPRIGGIILIIPIIIFSFIAVPALYRYWKTGVGYYY